MRSAIVAAIVASAVSTSTTVAVTHYLITNIHQISPKVVNELRGKRGPTGPEGKMGRKGLDAEYFHEVRIFQSPPLQQGPMGATGPQGPIGRQGSQGPATFPHKCGIWEKSAYYPIGCVVEFYFEGNFIGKFVWKGDYLAHEIKPSDPSKVNAWELYETP